MPMVNTQEPFNERAVLAFEVTNIGSLHSNYYSLLVLPFSKTFSGSRRRGEILGEILSV